MRNAIPQSRALLIGTMLAACAGLAACETNTRRYEADPNTDFAQLHSFAWQPIVAATAPTNPLDSELLHKRVRSAGSAALLARGFVQDDAAPQFNLVSKLIANDTGHKTGPALSVGFGLGSFGSSSASSIGVSGSTMLGKNAIDLTLVIEVHDAKSGELLWQGWRKVDDSISDASKPDLDQAVQAMLADFPPPKPKR